MLSLVAWSWYSVAGLIWFRVKRLNKFRRPAFTVARLTGQANKATRQPA